MKNYITCPIETITVEELDFIQDALNAYFHSALSQLQKNDLGDIERRIYIHQKEESLRLMNFLKTHQ